MSHIRLRATITFEYNANPASYRPLGSEPVAIVTPEFMADVDRHDLETGDLTHMDLSDDWAVTVEPVVGA